MRHTQVEGLPATFLPGFDQQLAILAVDTNYYDYYRSSNSSNTGRGLVNRIEGGIGVFGRRWQDSVGVTILSRHRLRDTIDVFKGRLASDTLVGKYRFTGETASLVKGTPVQPPRPCPPPGAPCAC